MQKERTHVIPASEGWYLVDATVTEMHPILAWCVVVPDPTGLARGDFATYAVPVTAQGVDNPVFEIDGYAVFNVITERWTTSITGRSGKGLLELMEYMQNERCDP